MTKSTSLESSKVKLTYKQYCYLLDRLKHVTKKGWNEDMVNAVFKSYFEVESHDDQIKSEIPQVLEKAKKYDNLISHTKYHNTFGCAYHFELKEMARKNQFLQSENQRLEKMLKELIIRK